jgi:hypothetical protein
LKRKKSDFGPRSHAAARSRHDPSITRIAPL